MAITGSPCGFGFAGAAWQTCLCDWADVACLYPGATAASSPLESDLVTVMTLSRVSFLTWNAVINVSQVHTYKQAVVLSRITIKKEIKVGCVLVCADEHRVCAPERAFVFALCKKKQQYLIHMFYINSVWSYGCCTESLIVLVYHFLWLSELCKVSQIPMIVLNRTQY